MQKTIATIFHQQVAQNGSRVAVRYKEKQTGFCDITWSAFGQLVNETAFGLANLGLNKETTAAILAPTSHWWIAVDLAIISTGAVSIPLYPTSSIEDLKYILKNSEASIIFVQGETLLKKILSIKNSLPLLKTIVVLPLISKGHSLSSSETGDNSTITLEELQRQGRELLLKEPSLISNRIDATKSSDAATIIYTSGTTGTPKGAIITHKNIVSMLADLTNIISLSPKETYLSYLPLSHVFERICGEFLWVYIGYVCAFAEGMEYLSKNMAEIKPTMILVVPRILDGIHAKIKNSIESSPSFKRKLVAWAINIGTNHVRLKSAGHSIPKLLKIQHWLAERLVFCKLRSHLNPNLKYIVSGGAPATFEVIGFFNAIGITTLEGYGLTETTAPAAVNRPHRIKPGTVGPVLPSVQIKLAEDGEILIKGPTVFKGYFKNDQATAEAFNGNWFRSGDIGTIDGDGYLQIVDRKKDLIVNSAGKNIAPQKLESILQSIPYVTQAMVFGDKKKYLVALLTLDEASIMEYGKQQGWLFVNFEQLIALPQLHKHIAQQINQLCAPLADHERIKKFSILKTDFSIEQGELTATLKMRRSMVAKRYHDLVQSLYQEDEVLVS